MRAQRDSRIRRLFLVLGVFAAAAAAGAPLFAQQSVPLPDDPVSPALRIQRAPQPDRGPTPQDPAVRSIDGSGNNLENASMGAAGTVLKRYAPADYADGVSAMSGPGRMSPRAISNLVVAQRHMQPNDLGASDFLWQWGQFLDHDLDLTNGTDPPESAPIAMPPGDPAFDPNGDGNHTMAFNRSLYDHDTGTGTTNPREQVNELTTWIDASQVYGSDETRVAALRTNDGTGRLRTSAGDLLPFNADGLPNGGGPSPELFLAGDVRVNEQVGLIALHTLFVREHNRLAGLITRQHPGWTDEQIYQRARQLVGAEMQAITYNEFLPALLGEDALPRYRGYNPSVDARIATEFSTAAFRFGHSGLSPTLQRLDERWREIPEGHLPLRDAFFAPRRIIDEGGIEPVLRGLAAQPMQRIDAEIVDDVRNFLFGAPGSGGFDLAALNLQRGRDHGLPTYNAVRSALGLRPAERFADVTSDRDVAQRLAAAYATADDIELWVGGLAEDRVGSGHVGPVIRGILVRQFTALRDGDRFWYRSRLSAPDIVAIESARLSDIIRTNTSIRDIPDDVFQARRRTR